MPCFCLPDEDPVPIANQYVSFNLSPDASLLDRIKKFKSQFRSIGAGALIFIAFGMNLTNAIVGESYYYRQAPVQSSIAGILGAFFAASVAKYLPRKIALYQAGALLVCGGFFSFLDMELFSSVLSGMAAGVAFIPTFALISEQADASIRAFIASWIDSICFGLGICIYLLCTAMFGSYDNLISIAWLNFFFGIFAIVMTYVWTNESPLWLLQHGQEEQAIEAQRLLQQPYFHTNEVNEKISDQKHLLKEAEATSFKDIASKSLGALVKICVMRFFVAISFSQIMALCRTPEILAVRFLGAVVGAFCIDRIGQKKPTCAATAGGAIIMIVVCISSAFSVDWLTITMIGFYQLTVGIVASASAAYTSEAFPLQVKPFYLAIAFSLERIFHALISGTYCWDLTEPFFYIIAVFCAVVFFFVKYFVPETKQMKLLEAQENFAKWKSVNTGF